MIFTSKEGETALLMLNKMHPNNGWEKTHTMKVIGYATGAATCGVGGSRDHRVDIAQRLTGSQDKSLLVTCTKIRDRKIDVGNT